MSHQEGKQTDDEERQDPHGVVPLVVQSQDAGKSCAGDYKHLRVETEEFERESHIKMSRGRLYQQDVCQALS